MRFVSIVLLCVAATMNSCSSGTDRTGSKGTGTQDTAAAQSKLGEVRTKKLLAILQAYYELKEDITTPAGPAMKSPRELSVRATDLMQDLRNDSLADLQLVAQLDTIQKEATAIEKLYDETGERKRIHFGVISSALYDLLQRVELKNVTVYRMYSNNAFNDKGAYWLSSDKEIRNPYFGKKLLEQGEITDTIK